MPSARNLVVRAKIGDAAIWVRLNVAADAVATRGVQWAATLVAGGVRAGETNSGRTGRRDPPAHSPHLLKCWPFFHMLRVGVCRVSLQLYFRSLGKSATGDRLWSIPYIANKPKVR